MTAETENQSASFAKMLKPYKSYILRFGPTVVVWIVWWTWALLDAEKRLGLFTDITPFGGFYFYMSITMVFGSMVAGATSEGGGAVAFPVMTLVLGVPPLVARDFSFGIQSFGMTCAAITIIGLKVPLDKEAIIYCTAGGLFGLLIGLEFIAPYLPDSYPKLLFVSVWTTFAVALFKLNSKGRDRTVYQSAVDSDKVLNDFETNYDSQESRNSESEADVESPGAVEGAEVETRDHEAEEKRQKRNRILVFLGTGFFGGICSSVAGSGLDIASFSMLTLFYRVSEKVATPTSVVLMAINTVVGVMFRLMGVGGAYPPGYKEAVWDFVSVCIPVVVVGAPLGATISARLPRHYLAYLIYILDAAQFITAMAVMTPWNNPPPHNIGLCVSSAGTLIIGSLFFFYVAELGTKRDGCAIKPSEDIAEVNEATVIPEEDIDGKKEDISGYHEHQS